MLATIYLLVGIYLGGLMLLAALVRRIFPESGAFIAMIAGGMWPMFMGWLIFGDRK